MEIADSFPLWPFILALVIPIIIFAIMTAIIEIVGAWFMFEKAGEPGWAAVGLFFLRWIFIPILGFGSAVYSGDKSNFGA
jgi:hypothetical protein